MSEVPQGEGSLIPALALKLRMLRRGPRMILLKTAGEQLPTGRPGPEKSTSKKAGKKKTAATKDGGNKKKITPPKGAERRRS